MGVSRGSFYWHFADIGAFHAAILEHWREVAAEQIIADVEALPPDDDALPALLRRAFGGRPALENAVRSWAARRSPARAPRCRPSTGAGSVMSRSLLTQPGCRPERPRPRADPLLGVSRLRAVGQAAADGSGRPR